MPVIFLKEEEQFVAYTPALDLTTSGETLEEAEKNFHEVVQIFFEECERMGTLEKVLDDLGWKKKGDEWISPLTVAGNSKMVTVALSI